jgi:hypothetical protein
MGKENKFLCYEKGIRGKKSSRRKNKLNGYVRNVLNEKLRVARAEKARFIAFKLVNFKSI